MLSYYMIPAFYHQYSDEHLAYIATSIFEHYPEEAVVFFQQHPNAPFIADFYVDSRLDKIHCMHSIDPDKTLFFFLRLRTYIDTHAFSWAHQQYLDTNQLPYAILLHYASYALEIPMPEDIPSFKECMAYFTDHTFSSDWRSFFLNNVHFMNAMGESALQWRNLLLKNMYDPQVIFDTVFIFDTPTLPFLFLYEHTFDTPLEDVAHSLFLLIQEGLLEPTQFYTELQRQYCNNLSAKEEITLYGV